ncbi:hypothetical protein U1Q18_009999 [Sarracenia purpurea var. burkii]
MTFTNSSISFMASISATSVLFFTILSLSSSVMFSATVVSDLNNLHPLPDFKATIINNCKDNPCLRYCNFTPSDLPEIFKFTIVASHLCNESRNPNCVDSFPKIDLHSRPKIAPLYLSFTFFWKYCPTTIISIDLSNNSLKGSFPLDLFHCSQIQALDLSHNEISGDLPIRNFSILANLTSLNLSYNNFSEIKISSGSEQFFKQFNNSHSFLHSGLVPDHGKFRTKALLLLIGFPIFVVFMVVFLRWLCFSRPDFLPRIFQRKHRFTPSMLKAATNGFSKKNLVVNSDGVEIYKGILRDGTEVRIETYWDRKISREERRDFVEKCKILVGLSHKNLVPVLGWCENRGLRAVVAEWIGGENLEMWLSRSDPPWNHRVKVLVRIAEAMRYLQEEWPEVGYDLKSSSVLLSDDHHREPLISRFRFKDQNNCRKKVYKFGVLLLEMVSNQRPQETFERGEAGFVEWVRMHFPKNVENLIDEKMRKTEQTLNQAMQTINLGLMCTDLSRERQPSLDQVLEAITIIYNSVLASSSPAHIKMRADRVRGHRQVQSR